MREVLAVHVNMQLCYKDSESVEMLRSECWELASWRSLSVLQQRQVSLCKQPCTGECDRAGENGLIEYGTWMRLIFCFDRKNGTEPVVRPR